MKTNPKENCIIKDCINIRTIRGLCRPCYLYARYQVVKGKVTWEILEKNKLSLPPINKGCGETPFKIQFKKLKQK